MARRNLSLLLALMFLVSMASPFLVTPRCSLPLLKRMPSATTTVGELRMQTINDKKGDTDAKTISGKVKTPSHLDINGIINVGEPYFHFPPSSDSGIDRVYRILVLERATYPQD